MTVFSNISQVVGPSALIILLLQQYMHSTRVMNLYSGTYLPIIILTEALSSITLWTWGEVIKQDLKVSRRPKYYFTMEMRDSLLRLRIAI